MHGTDRRAARDDICPRGCSLRSPRGRRRFEAFVRELARFNARHTRASRVKGQTMAPRIRSFLPRPPFAREKKAPAAKEAPRVFREFVETLQRLDPPRRAAAGAGAAVSRNRAAGAPLRKRGYGRRPRRKLGNGHADPRTQRGRRRPR
jgi:hypothetical protein